MNVTRAAGAAGEWALFTASVGLVFQSHGLKGAAALILGWATPSFVLGKSHTAVRLLAPAGGAGLALFADGLWAVAISSVAVGAGTAAAGRTPAPLTGLFGAPGWMGVLGAVAGWIAAATLDLTPALLAASGLLLIGCLEKAGQTRREPVTGALLPAAAAVGLSASMRVLEPAFILDEMSGPAYAFAWAFGAQTGWRLAEARDVRGALAGPFIVAASLAAMAEVEGPGSLFLWTLAAGGTALVLGTGSPGVSGRLRLTPYAAAFLAGVALLPRAGGLDNLLLAMGGICLTAGFVSMILRARDRERPPEPVAAEMPVISRVPKPYELDRVPAQDTIRDALSDLLDASRQASAMRRAAIGELRAASDPWAPLRARWKAELKKLSASASDIRNEVESR